MHNWRNKKQLKLKKTTKVLRRKYDVVIVMGGATSVFDTSFQFLQTITVNWCLHFHSIITLNIEFTYNETERRKKGKLFVGCHFVAICFTRREKWMSKSFGNVRCFKKLNVVRGFIQLQVYNHIDDAANVEVEKVYEKHSYANGQNYIFS